MALQYDVEPHQHGAARQVVGPGHGTATDTLMPPLVPLQESPFGVAITLLLLKALADATCVAMCEHLPQACACAGSGWMVHFTAAAPHNRKRQETDWAQNTLKNHKTWACLWVGHPQRSDSLAAISTARTGALQ